MNNTFAKRKTPTSFRAFLARQKPGFFKKTGFREISMQALVLFKKPGFCRAKKSYEKMAKVFLKKPGFVSCAVRTRGDRFPKLIDFFLGVSARGDRFPKLIDFFLELRTRGERRWPRNRVFSKTRFLKLRSSYHGPKMAQLDWLCIWPVLILGSITAKGNLFNQFLDGGLEFNIY